MNKPTFVFDAADVRYHGHKDRDMREYKLGDFTSDDRFMKPEDVLPRIGNTTSKWWADIKLTRLRAQGDEN